ncbi:MAG TPA: hypothetical protein VER03_05045 [Bryobacteraceae bacterium]|nr:hypothetical protein [Bryobacteraceae bacterium]
MLLLSLPSAAELTAIAAALPDGLIVGLAPAEEVYEARKAVNDFDNCMFAPADPDGVIPWRDEFFTVIYAPHLDGVSSEMERVLTTGGSVHLSSSIYTKPNQA